VNGPQHYAEADRLLAEARTDPPPSKRIDTAIKVDEAQAHATLALVAAVLQAAAQPHAINTEPWQDAIHGPDPWKD
jgi:hypothetical protein